MTEATAPPESDWHAMETAAVISTLKSNAKLGLSDVEAKNRLAIYGLNEIEEIKKVSPWKLLLGQFRETLIVILIAAAFISAIIGEAIDAAVILAIVIASAGLGFYQEYRAEQSLALLKQLAAPTATTIRNGQETLLPTRELVPGDLILLESGNKVPADARIIEQMNLQVDEATLTGESSPVNKSTEKLKPVTSLPERNNITYSGTVVTYGRGKAVIYATGMRTEFGKIARLIQTDKEEKTPLEERMDDLGNWMIKVLLVTVTVVTLLGVLRGNNLIDMFLWGISLAVAAVPEALPAVVTGALAVGVYRMARRNAIVRHLPATETLGSTSVICTDKTGTLTKGEMTVRKILTRDGTYELTGVGYDPKGELITKDSGRDLVNFTCLCGALCNDSKLVNQDGSWRIIGDPTEGALLVAATKTGLDLESARNTYPRIAEIPFTSERKMMTTIHKMQQQFLLTTKGAPELVLEECTKVGNPESSTTLSKTAKEQFLKANEEFASQGFRVLAVSYKLLNQLPQKLDEALERELSFLGLFTMIDPPREEATEALRLCTKAGIRVIMITGDQKPTASWVAREIGILRDGDQTLTGMELDKLTDDEFSEKVEEFSVYSRTSPEHKMRIVTALKRKGNIVAMTGDGINDAPALKKSDIGISMGLTGTDVTKDASDMILADDNFATIVSAVFEGRGIFENIRKYLTFLISSNIGEILLMALAGLFALPLPLLAKHLLFVNLATDGLPALALGMDPPDPRLMEKPPRNPKETIFKTVHGWLGGIAVLLVLTATVAFAYGLLSYGWTFNNPVALAVLKARSMVFATIIFFEIFFAFSCRSFDRTFLSLGPLGNRTLALVVIGQAILMPFLFQIPILANLFSITALSLTEWLIVLGLGLLGFVASEITKILRQRTR